MNEPISLKEILAVIVRRGRVILCFAVIAAILAGAYQFKVQYAAYRNPANVPEQFEAVYQIQTAEYNKTLSEYNKQLDAARRSLEQQLSYNENSILMQVDPYNMALDTFVLAITDVTEIQSEAYSQKEVNPGYFIDTLQNYYLQYWNSLSLSQTLTDNPYPELAERYLRELVGFYVNGNGVLTITAVGLTEADAAALGDSIYRAFMALYPTVKAATYDHSISLVSHSARYVVDANIESLQTTNLTSAQEKKTNVTNLENQIHSLAVPEMGVPMSKKTVVIQSAKWAVLGAFVGIVLACIWILVLFLMRSRAESSRQMERILGIAFLGSVAKKGSIWERMARKLLGERVWKDADTAAAFLAQSVESAVEPDAPLAVLTTLNTKDAESALVAVSEAVSPVCPQVSCVKNAEKNPDAVALLRDCKTVLLAERPGVSNTPEIRSLMDMAEKQDVRIVGFVTI